MIWKNLKENKCPQCNHVFGYANFQTPGLITCQCGFAIREKRYGEIIQSQITQDLEDKWNEELGERRIHG